MSICEDCGEPHFYEYGDRVQLTQNPLVKGQVVGERSWGEEYNVRLIGLLKTEWFYAVELEPDPECVPPVAGAKTPESGDTGAPTGGAEIINLAAVRAAGRG